MGQKIVLLIIKYLQIFKSHFAIIFTVSFIMHTKCTQLIFTSIQCTGLPKIYHVVFKIKVKIVNE